ncbi:PA-phosphatase [Brevundimonas sp. BR2-1]|uniref:PA-phosphatase n=1 Tax=unclassified Brevundimonas TaxID=2622653 RepID=UPI002FCA5632
MSRAAALAACALLGACATGVAPGAAEAPQGYLEETAIRSLADATPPPGPWSGSDLPSVEPGADRWWMATAHAWLAAPEGAQHFDCVLGARFAQKPRPALTRLMNRLLVDADRLTRLLAEQTPRPRPIRAIEGLEPCQRINDAIRDGSSWPAGGAVAGAAYGEMFAALAPDRAAEARRIGREIGLSRAVCRMNWTADVTDGAVLGQRLFAAEASPAFADDLEAARAEVAAARAEGLTSPGCAAERRAFAQAGAQAGRGATSEP